MICVTRLKIPPETKSPVNLDCFKDYVGTLIYVGNLGGYKLCSVPTVKKGYVYFTFFRENQKTPFSSGNPIVPYIVWLRHVTSMNEEAFYKNPNSKFFVEITSKVSLRALKKMEVVAEQNIVGG